MIGSSCGQIAEACALRLRTIDSSAICFACGLVSTRGRYRGSARLPPAGGPVRAQPGQVFFQSRVTAEIIDLLARDPRTATVVGRPRAASRDAVRDGTGPILPTARGDAPQVRELVGKT